LVLPVLVIASLTKQEFRQRAATSSTITVTNTAIGTTQTQLSTNIVTWASDMTQIPNGQATLNAMHLPLVRLHVGDDGGSAMSEINQGSWDMTTMNTMVNDVFATGQQPLLNIKFAPDWMWTCYPNSVGINGAQGVGTVKDLTFQTFAQYMARLASYYNKGSLTEENGTVLVNPAGTTHKITYWELWNEPDLNIETPCAPADGLGITYQQYTTMWNAVTAAMLAVDPTIKFIGPAGAGAQFGSTSSTGNQYIDYLMANSTVKPYAISFHAYGYWANGIPDKYYFDGDGSDGGGGITDILAGAQGIRNIYPTYPVWITEVNVNSDWGASGQNNDELTAAWWGEIMQSMVPLNMGIINQFDYTGSSISGLIDGEGLNNSSYPTGKPMISYYILQQIDKAFPQGSTLLQSSSAQAGILSLAARKPDGTVSVMIVNRELASSTVQSSCGTGGVAATVTVDLSALNPSSITNTQIDKNNVDCSTWYGIAPTTQNLSIVQPVTITFPGYGIAILNVAANGQVTSSTVTPTLTPISTPTLTQAPTHTPTPALTSTPTPKPTSTLTPTLSPTTTPISTPTPTPPTFRLSSRPTALPSTDARIPWREPQSLSRRLA
jgi:hypothetical protein